MFLVDKKFERERQNLDVSVNRSIRLPRPDNKPVTVRCSELACHLYDNYCAKLFYLRSRISFRAQRLFDLLTRYQRKSKSVNQKGVPTVV